MIGLKGGLFSLFTVCLAFGSESPAHWPGWRGPDGNGTANGKPPTVWSETENITWKKQIPGFGLATPVIWGDKLFVLTAIATERKAENPPEVDEKRSWSQPVLPDHYKQFLVMALDRHTGETLWKQQAIEALPHEGTHGDASWASCSPVTDGDALVASFGSAGIYCYDLEGKLLWQVDLGNMRTRNAFGEGSSPVISEDRVFVNWDHEDQSFLVALDKKSGREIWRTQRDEPTSWSTPVVVTVEGQKQVVVNAANKIRGYHFENGSEIWSCGGMTLNVVPTPNVSGNTLFATSGFRGNALVAINMKGASGDITDGPNVLWKLDRDTPYVPSMLLYKDALFFIKTNKGILTRVEASTGKVSYGPQRLEGVTGIYASPVGAGGHVYLLGREGNALVVDAGATYELVAHNTLDDKFDASPAIAGNALYLRGHKSLYCIGSTR